MAGLALIACGGGEEQNVADGPGLEGPPEAATERLLSIIGAHEWAVEWDSLHPEQQKFVSRDAFVSCAESEDSPGIESVEVLESRSDAMLIPGTEIHAASTAVTVEGEFVENLMKRSQFRDTIQLFEVEGRWRWVLPNIEAYKSGACPD